MFYTLGAVGLGLALVGGIAKMCFDMIAQQRARADRPRKPWDIY